MFVASLCLFRIYEIDSVTKLNCEFEASDCEFIIVIGVIACFMHAV